MEYIVPMCICGAIGYLMAGDKGAALGAFIGGIVAAVVVGKEARNN